MTESTGSLKSFEQLECWKACRDVRQYVSQLVKGYPREERFRMVDQMVRASRSCTHNIAEGYGRFHYQENIQFCRQARGSLFELRDQLLCSLDDGLITREQDEQGAQLIQRAAMLLNGYIRYLDRTKKAGASRTKTTNHDRQPANDDNEQRMANDG